ncbi:MAG TPA: hypothetical protein VNA30_03240, partial [Mycobacteriales bacterium]|nr:hypothetical protein [Mycobacteriales bacterium]
MAPALSAQAADGRRTIRVVTWEYALFTNAAHDISPDPDNDLCVFLGSIMTCTDLKFAQHETEVRVQASDASGRPVPLEYRLGDAGPELSICGTGSVKLDRAREMSIHTVV